MQAIRACKALRTLVYNLVDNALRYTPSGGRVDVVVGNDARRASLAVRDNGPGIPPADRSRVFDRFYRGSGAEGVGGSGLGLAIAKRIAERHGAAIELGPGIDGAGLGVIVTFTQDGTSFDHAAPAARAAST
jgi:two-component system OmpR family sensor kinase